MTEIGLNEKIASLSVPVDVVFAPHFRSNRQFLNDIVTYLELVPCVITLLASSYNHHHDGAEFCASYLVL